MIRPPWYLRLAYPGVIWNIPSDQKIIYLTFDDGPIPEVTPQILSILNKYNAKATFFCIGDNVRKNPELYNQLLEDGHATGNHTFHHYNSWKISKTRFLQDVYEARQLINSTLFRPPYGKLTPSTLFSLRKDYKIILWDVISCDFDVRVPKETVLYNSLKYTRPGSIIVFHDSLKAANNVLYTLPLYLEHFSKLGFEFKKLPQ